MGPRGRAAVLPATCLAMRWWPVQGCYAKAGDVLPSTASLGESLNGNAAGAVLGYPLVHDVTKRSTGARASVLRGGEQAGSVESECSGGEARKARPETFPRQRLRGGVAVVVAAGTLSGVGAPR